MYVAKLVLYWIIILCFRQETQAKPTIYMPNRTRVALAGETLYFNLSVDIPANYTTNKLKCYHTQSRMIIWSKELKSEFFETTNSVMAHIKMRNSSSSGNYYFYYTDQQVHLVVHVRDKGYQQPPEELDSVIITMMAFSGILLIFSVAGSLYILKSYKEKLGYTLCRRNIRTYCNNSIYSNLLNEHPACRDDKNEVAEQRPGGNDEVILDEDPASASLYTALQYRSSSIYDSLHPDTMHEENTLKKKSVKKHCKAQEDEVFDSVYENL